MLKSKKLRTVLGVLCAGFWLLTIPAAAQSPVVFEARRDFPTNGLQAQSVVTNDFNQDGKLDLATVNARTFDVTVQTGAGDGTFQTTGSFFAGGSVNRGPIDLADGDLNNDGKLDLAVAALEGTVAVLIGNGDGTFQSPLIFGAGVLPQSVAVGDLNGDGNLDIATVNFANASIPDSHSLAVLLGNGDGTFREARLFNVGSQPFDLAIADFNSDRRPDVAVTFRGPSGSNGGISLLIGNGDGTFRTATTLSGVSSTLAILAEDINGDGRIDLAATSTSSKTGTLRLLFGNGNGGFSNGGSFSIGLFALSVTAGDFNGDGRKDLATASRDSQEVAVVLSQGTGFQTPAKYVAGRDPFAIVDGDFNRDGLVDLATANFSSNSLTVLIGKGAGKFAAETTFAAGGKSPQFAVAADFNRDCKMDLVTANIESNNVSVLLGNGDGSFQRPAVVRVGTQPFHLAVGEFNGDGVPDLAVANSGVAFSDPGNVSILLGSGNGSFRQAITIPAADAPASISVGDFNRDTRDDLAVVNFRSNSVSILLGQGNGNFQPAQALNFPTLSGLISSAAGDFNGDGLADLEIVSTFQSTVFVMLSNGDGTFRQSSKIVFPLIRSIGVFAVADLDKDGRLDLAGSSGIVLMGNGDGTFRTIEEFRPTASESIAAGDLDGDGFPDLMTTGGFALRVAVHVGKGDGTFQPEIRFGAGGFPVSILAADFSGDGKPDMVTANSLNNITLMLNRKPIFTTRTPVCRL
jgi:hypothetical protein